MYRTKKRSRGDVPFDHQKARTASDIGARYRSVDTLQSMSQLVTEMHSKGAIANRARDLISVFLTGG
jgi:hypothetical protein